MVEMIVGAVIAVVCLSLGFLFAVLISVSRRRNDDG